jgi:hypothetical protein
MIARSISYELEARFKLVLTLQRVTTLCSVWLC